MDRLAIRRTPQYKTARKIIQGITLTAWCGAMLYMLAYPSQDRPINTRFRRSAETESKSTTETEGSPSDTQLNKIKSWPGKCSGNLRQFERTAFTGEFTKSNQTSKWESFSAQYEDDFMDRYNAEHEGKVIPDLPWTTGSEWNEAYNYQGVVPSEDGENTFLGQSLCCLEFYEEKAHHQGARSEFPHMGLFTDEEIKSGGVIVHIFFSFYMFTALAIVCDDYFVPALERISEELKLSEDVAGATFMAAGSSAPELFTSVISCFVAKSDIGIGTIVGSAVFNILVIIGACGLFVKGDIPLSRWPLFRDSSFYLLTIICLLAVIFPDFDNAKCPAGKLECPVGNEDCSYEERLASGTCSEYTGMSRFDLLFGEGQNYSKSIVDINEAVFMLFMYSIYIAIMKFNVPIGTKICSILGWQGPSADNNNDDDQKSQQDVQLENLNEEKIALNVPTINTLGGSQTNLTTEAVKNVINNETKDFDDAGLRVMMSSSFAPRTRLRMAAKLVAKNQNNFMVAKEGTKTLLIQKKAGGDDKSVNSFRVQENNSNNVFKNTNNNNSEAEEDDDDEGPSDPWELPTDGIWSIIKHFLLWPINVTLWYTVPQCGDERWKQYYMASFIIATGWIAFYSYIMVWMVAYTGWAFNIPEVVMGLTFLAAGTSVPDTIASILVAKQGLGDMAVSNSIGSNVFDILLGLALPWTLQIIMAETIYEQPRCPSMGQFATFVTINSKGLVVSVAMLLASLVFVVSVIHFNGWKLNTKAGILITIAYIAFVAGSIYNEAINDQRNK